MSKENNGIYRFLYILCFVLLVFLGKYLFMAPKFSDGHIAPEFSTTLVDGTPFSLSELRGNYVLLDFWGTWCGPCREQLPQLKELHQKYHNKSIINANNFYIVSVALEREGDLERTKRAIAKLGLAWDYHIFDPISNFKILNAKIATDLYGVREVPTKYLIGPDGGILGVNMSFDEMIKVIDGK